MAITAISYDWGVEPTMVRITTTDTLSTITTAGYWSDEAVAVAALNNGAFTFPEGCLIAISYSGGQNTFTYDSATLAFIPAVGQYIEAEVTTASPLSLTTAVTSDITSISVPAGEWDVFGVFGIITATTTNVTLATGWSSPTTAAFPDNNSYSRPIAVASGIVPGNTVQTHPIPTLRFSLSETTTIYLSTQAVFTVDTTEAYGRISASKVG